MFLLKTEDLNLKLEIVPLSTLIPHEAIISNVSQRLTMEFANFANLHHPIIIEKNNIVLDGNHRVSVFKKLGFKHIAVCRINYFNRCVKLRYWFRLLGNMNDLAILESIIHQMGGRLDSVPTKAALIDALTKNYLSWGIQQGSCFNWVRFSREKVSDAIESYRALEKLQNQLVREDASLEYIPCESARSEDVCEKIQPNDVIIWTPHIGKNMIVAATQVGSVFAPKTTRHLIPARPLNINIPGQWLKEDISLDDINERFTNYLTAKRIRKFGPGQVIDGRFYGETVFVFYD